MKLILTVCKNFYLLLLGIYLVIFLGSLFLLVQKNFSSESFIFVGKIMVTLISTYCVYKLFSSLLRLADSHDLEFNIGMISRLLILLSFLDLMGVAGKHIFEHSLPSPAADPENVF